MADKLKQRAVNGATWLGFNQVYRQGMSLLVMGILAHHLGPEAFGLIGMVVVFTAFLEIFQEIGLSQAVIQRKDVTEEQLATVFWITVACGVTLAGMTALASPLIAAFYSEPELVRIARWLGLSFVINSFTHVHGALLRKALAFRKLTLINMAGHLVTSATTITLAYRGFGVYALVFQSLVGGTINLVLMWACVRWRPKARPRLASVKSLIRFGANVTGTGILAYANASMDYLLIGRFLGASALGLYTIAYRIMLMPVRRVTSQISQVAFPAFAAVQDDKPRVCRGFLQMTSNISLVVFPAMAGLLVVAPEAVPVLLGDQWRRSILIVQVLALTGALQAVTSTIWTIFRSQGRADLQFQYGIFATIVTVAAFAIGLRWNIEGVAVAYTISQALVMPPRCRFAFGLIDLSFSDYYRSLRAPLIASAFMTAVVLMFRLLILRMGILSMSTLLVGEIALGVVTYGVALHFVSPETVRETIDLVKMVLGRTREDPKDKEVSAT